MSDPSEEVSINDLRRRRLAQAQRLGLAPETEGLIASRDFPPAPSSMPLIVDTDLGGDPDDAIALVVAAKSPQLALVVTSDEIDGRRARLARFLLDQLGRTDVPVIAGRDLGQRRYWAADGLVPDDVTTQTPMDLTETVNSLVEDHGRVRWLGIGPWSNLADLIETTDLASRLDITLMGGGLNYRHADRAEHNIRLDPAAARVILHSGLDIRMIGSDVTFHADNEVVRDSAEFQILSAIEESWAQTVVRHLEQWFESFHPGTMQHDALALAVALGLPFVNLRLTGVDLDPIGRMVPGDHKVMLAHTPNHAAFRRWLVGQLRADQETS